MLNSVSFALFLQIPIVSFIKPIFIKPIFVIFYSFSFRIRMGTYNSESITTFYNTRYYFY
jgi:hypothetical protein